MKIRLFNILMIQVVSILMTNPIAQIVPITPLNNIEENIYDYIEWLSEIDRYSEFEEIKNFRDVTKNPFWPVYVSKLYCPNMENDSLEVEVGVILEYEDEDFDPNKEALIINKEINYRLCTGGPAHLNYYIEKPISIELFSPNNLDSLVYFTKKTLISKGFELILEKPLEKDTLFLKGSFFMTDIYTNLKKYFLYKSTHFDERAIVYNSYFLVFKKNNGILRLSSIDGSVLRLDFSFEYKDWYYINK